jgi:isopentenyl-diphosphate Delta-isomerase
VTQPAFIERVVLVGEDDAPLGAAEKLEAHRRGALHRAFSVFALNGAGELLLQRRAHGKYHSGGLWSNSACGHPRPGEGTAEAARRRLYEELGVTCGALTPAGILRYETVLADLVENELDHLLVTEVAGMPSPDPDEVADWRFVAPAELDAWVARRPQDFTVWFPPAWRMVAEAAA